jgi:hypothetical protein
MNEIIRILSETTRTMKKDTLENRMIIEHNRNKIPDSKLSMGSVINKYPIVLDDGKTIIFISDKSKETETRQKYKLQRESKILPYLRKQQ